MVNLVWNDVLSVGLESIDKQHKKLIDYIQQVLQLINDKADSSSISKSLKDLHDYVVYHFSYEANEFEKAGYDKSEMHRKEHDSYIDMIHKTYLDFNNNSNINLDEILHFLKDWIFNHIMVKDRIMAKVLISHIGKNK